jgi:hypothetical protein
MADGSIGLRRAKRRADGRLLLVCFLVPNEASMSTLAGIMAGGMSPARPSVGPACRARAAWLLVAMLCWTGSAAAAEQVYIWRDPSGAVRFTAVEEPDHYAADRGDDAGACTPEQSTAAIANDPAARASR